MPKNINLKIDQTTYEIIILQNKIPYISRGLTLAAEGGPGYQGAAAESKKNKIFAKK